MASWLTTLAGIEALRRAGIDLLTSANVLGYIASALALMTFCMQDMVPLRLIALASNAAFIAYAWVAHLTPIMVLHCILTFVNAASLRRACWPSQRERQTSVREAGHPDIR